MSATQELFLGIDLGTGGVRAVAAAASGRVVAQASVDLPPSPAHPVPEGHEQDPEAWWRALCAATGRLMGDLRGAGLSAEALQGLAVDGTSGTLVCVDAAGEAVRPGMMYNDGRATAEADALNELATDLCDKLGYRFAASYALAKLLWVRDREPEAWARTAVCLHQADFAVGRLTGRFDLTDYSNALKTGYDLVEEVWPAWLDGLDGVRERLPQVVAPGERIGVVTATAAAQTGLPAGLPVVAGATDGTAGCLASGVRRPGDYNTTLGTTLTFKGVSRALCRHPDGLIYSHKLPGGLWLPGAASNTGGEWMAAMFPGADLQAMDAAAESLLPGAAVAYPLARTGERFPFRSGGAVGFCEPEPASQVERYAAHLQGTALVERLGYEVLDAVAGTTGGEVYGTGGGSRSDVWMQCRADATGRTYHRPSCPESAFGCAVLAAAGTRFGEVWAAVEAMVRVEASFEPRPERRQGYDEAYGRLVEELRTRGYFR